MSINGEFRLITGLRKNPYPHQVKCMKHLLEGKSAILRAPTGSGKSEAAVVPFLSHMNETLPSQMIYSLPVRVLVDDLAKRFRRYANVKWLNVAAHHGKRIETPLFYPPIIVTTIDQTVGAYTCTPLSLPLRHGNIPAGAVSSAFLVFDEVHTFDPERALQSAVILAEHAEKLKLPFIFMSATMPSSFTDKLRRIFKLKKEQIIDAREEDIPVRKNRNVIVRWEDRRLTSEAVKEKYESSEGKVLVVCNTVSKAQNIFKNLWKNVDCEIILLHSRFLEEDRKKWEKKLEKIFGRDSKEKGILVSTQVIEVGLNISCDTMLTELSPIDSLIQRAGRCARWGGNGYLHVYEVERSRPYKEELVNETRREIKKVNGRKLDWRLEKLLVNSILGKYAKEWLKPENTANILNTLAQAAFEGKRELAESAVRQVFSCEISICNDPYKLEDPYLLKKIKIDVRVLRKFFNENQPTMWQFVDNNILFDEAPKIVPCEINAADEISPYKFYVIHPDAISYSKETGLLFEPRGKNFGYMEEEIHKKPEYSYEDELWVKHSKNTLQKFEYIFVPRYQFAFNKFANAWKMNVSKFLEKLRVIMALHDIGKLNENWQRRIGWHKDMEPLAHFRIGTHPPPHATVSARALDNIFNDWGENLGYALELAVAHHHSVRAHEVPNYKLIDNWERHVAQLISKDYIDKIVSKGGGRIPTFPGIEHEKSYRTYAFVSRLLRLSDRIATGGSEDAILRYENWYGPF